MTKLKSKAFKIILHYKEKQDSNSRFLILRCLGELIYKGSKKKLFLRYWVHIKKKKYKYIYFKGVNDQTDDFQLSCCVEPKGKNNTTKAVAMLHNIILLMIFLARILTHKITHCKTRTHKRAHIHTRTHRLSTLIILVIVSSSEIFCAWTISFWKFIQRMDSLCPRLCKYHVVLKQ